MEKRDNMVHLDDEEERLTGYPNPINLTVFDLHGERSRADATIARLEVDLAAGTVSGPGPQEALRRARAQSDLTRMIAKEWAIEAAAANLDQELRDLTQ